MGFDRSQKETNKNILEKKHEILLKRPKTTSGETRNFLRALSYQEAEQNVKVSRCSYRFVIFLEFIKVSRKKQIFDVRKQTTHLRLQLNSLAGASPMCTTYDFNSSME